MNPRIALITLLADDVRSMVDFYSRGLGFQIKQDMGMYVELMHDGVRFAICDRDVMLKATNHRSYLDSHQGQAVELAFPCDSLEGVDEAYSHIIQVGGKPVQPPASMPWGQRAAFFADPEGNIHEFFSEIHPSQVQE